MTKEKKMELVFIPPPLIGHLVSHVEFAKRLLDQDDRLSVTFLIVDPFFSHKFQSYVGSLAAAASVPRLRFINFPQVLEADPLTVTKHPLVHHSEFLEGHKSGIKEYIINQVFPNYSASGAGAGFVVDLTTTLMIDVANELGLPSYLFYTSSASVFRFMSHAITRHDQLGRAFRASDGDFVIPGCANPLPWKVIPSFLFDETGGAYSCFLNSAKRLAETKAIIINSFEELESQVVKSLLLLERDLPPIYLVGPVVDLRGHTSSLCECDDVQCDDIMKWLDNQPPSTVVFLCFGSLLDMDEPQVVEIAKGLEQSRHRFIWSLRVQSSSKNLKDILPEGFLQRTKGRGLVCGWVPQVKVLDHKSTGGFVSHCGWNSILESIWYGVPILTWPMHSEQQLNALQMVKDLGLAVEMRLDYNLGESDLVRADEIGKAIKCLMDDPDGNEVRKKVKKMSQMSREAVSKERNGTSFNSYDRIIELFMTGTACPDSWSNGIVNTNFKFTE